MAYMFRPKTLMFNGKAYHLESQYERRWEADNRARNWRTTHLARVHRIKAVNPTTGKSIPAWGIFVRKKR